MPHNVFFSQVGVCSYAVLVAPCKVCFIWSALCCLHKFFWSAVHIFIFRPIEYSCLPTSTVLHPFNSVSAGSQTLWALHPLRHAQQAVIYVSQLYSQSSHHHSFVASKSLCFSLISIKLLQLKFEFSLIFLLVLIKDCTSSNNMESRFQEEISKINPFIARVIVVGLKTWSDEISCLEFVASEMVYL